MRSPATSTSSTADLHPGARDVEGVILPRTWPGERLSEAPRQRLRCGPLKPRPVSSTPRNPGGDDDAIVGPDMDARYGVCGRTTPKEWTRRRSGAPGGLMRGSKLCTRI